MPKPDVIVLAIDGLRASSLGAYGNTWRPTPAFDRVASESLLVEWAYATQAEPADFYSNAWPDESRWSRTTLVTDDPAIAKLPAFAAFDAASIVETAAITRPADRIGDTLAATSFAAFADAIAEVGDDDENVTGGDQGATLVWLHCRGLAGPWDAPTSLVQELVEDDDPQPPISIEPARGEASRQEDPDALFCAACRYAAQITVLDACVEGWLEYIDHLFADDPPIIVLAGLRGYSLGEHGRIGLDESGPYSESRQVPLLIRSPNSSPGRRAAEGLFDLSSLPALASGLTGQPPETVLAEHFQEEVLFTGKSASAIRTLEWLLIERPSESGDADAAELYLKPDDRWEANDVASLRREVVDTLTDKMRNLGKRADERC